MFPTKIPLTSLALGATILFSHPLLAQEASEETTLDQDAVEIEAEENPAIIDHVLGQEDAPLTVVEYASFTCPHCMDFEEEVMPHLKSEYIETGKVRYIYREVYFDGAGLLAASLARCVPAEQYYPMVFTLYSTHETWLDSQSSAEGIINELTKLGVMAGLSKDKIAQCLDDRETQEIMVNNSASHMEEDNVRGTPAVLLNGEKVEDWQWESFQPLLETKLEESGFKAE